MALISICLFAGSNLLIYSFRHTQQRYSAFGQLSSHMTAFTLIQATGELHVSDDGSKCFLVDQTSWNHFVLCRVCGSRHAVLPESPFVVAVKGIAVDRGPVLAERLRAKCVGGLEVHWEYQAADEEVWRPSHLKPAGRLNLISQIQVLPWTKSQAQKMGHSARR